MKGTAVNVYLGIMYCVMAVHFRAFQLQNRFEQIIFSFTLFFQLNEKFKS